MTLKEWIEHHNLYIRSASQEMERCWDWEIETLRGWENFGPGEVIGRCVPPTGSRCRKCRIAKWDYSEHIVVQR